MCHKLTLPTSGQRRRLSTALGQPVQAKLERSGPYWTVARKALPPAQVATPAQALPPAQIQPVAPPAPGPEKVKKAVETVRDAGERPEMASPRLDERVSLLERRLAKLNGLLDSRDAELAQLRSQKTPDTGVASKYREPQGIREDDENGEAKKAMMAVLFEANLKLHRGISSQTQSAD